MVEINELKQVLRGLGSSGSSRSYIFQDGDIISVGDHDATMNALQIAEIITNINDLNSLGIYRVGSYNNGYYINGVGMPSSTVINTMVDSIIECRSSHIMVDIGSDSDRLTKILEKKACL